MCRHCFGNEVDLFDDMFSGYRRGGRRSDPFGFGGMDGDVNRDGFASVSQRAMGALDNAQKIFLQHLSTVDTSRGPVTTEIIQFHLVPDMRKRFNKYVKEYGCIGTSRQLTRAEQDLINKTRKSLLWYTSVKVTPQAQADYFAKHPHVAKPKPTAAVPAASTSGASAASASSSASSSSASGSVSGSSPATSVSSAAKVVRDLTANKKAKAKLNQAAVNHAATSGSIKWMNSLAKPDVA